MKKISIPKKFYDDHVARELPAPPIIRELSRLYEIDADHEHMVELINDCRFYCDPYGPEEGSWKKAARALRRSLLSKTFRCEHQPPALGPGVSFTSNRQIRGWSAIFLPGGVIP